MKSSETAPVERPLHYLTNEHLHILASASVWIGVEFKAPKRVGNVTPELIGRQIAMENIGAVRCATEWNPLDDVALAPEFKRLGAYKFEFRAADLHEVLKACDAADMLCERSPTWYGSKARDYIDRLRWEIRRILVQTDPSYAKDPKYQAAAWSI